jgi:hypothetical protein
MSANTERTIKTAVLVAGTIALLGMAWTSKADKADVDALAHKIDAVLTLQCRTSPDDTICRNYK